MIFGALFMLVPAAGILCGAVKRYDWFVRREHMLMSLFVILCFSTILYSCTTALAS